MSEETKETVNDEPAPAAPAASAPPPPKIPSLLQNYLSFIGIAIAVVSLTCIVLLFLIDLTSETEQPYLAILTFIMLPGVLVFGLFVVLVGALLERRRRRKLSPEQIAAFPILDFNNPQRRRTFLLFIVAAFLFLMVSAFGSYRAFEFSESVTFCGEACHTVMKPEFVAYQASPHSQIRCVECHVGGGAESYVRAKMGGMRQLYKVLTDSYEAPIKTPVHNMRAANETCGKCHWADKFYGEQLKVFNHYGYDEKNSVRQTRMLIKVGGGNPKLGEASGIHWHMNLANEVTFIASDDRRQKIPWVRMKDANGNVTEYTARGSTFSPQEIEVSEKRRMDCIDCHNRPTHIYLSPNNAVDQSLDANKLDKSLPFIKMKAVEVLAAKYANNDEAVNAIAAGLDDFYKTNHPDVYAARKGSVDEAIAEVQRIYQTYFFPEMKTDWSTHPNNIGHFNAQGCFRCHDNQHVSTTGKVIRNDCNICHTTLDQSFAGQMTPAVNGAFKHPKNLGDRGSWQCAVCHKGDRAFEHPLNLGDISRFECADCHKGSEFKMKLP
jgi:nitrate/TMAO reductase-like tetraheme cytochrome c subunit